MKNAVKSALKTGYFITATVLLMSLLLSWGIIVPEKASAAPPPPGGLTAVKVSNGQIDLAWVDNSNNETGFHIESATNTAFTAGMVTFTVGPNVRTYSDTSVYAGATFYYRVTSFDATGDSAPSNVASVFIPLLSPGIPAAPGGLSAIAASATQVNLTWADNSLDEVGFLIERAGDAGFSAGLTSFIVAPDIQSYIDQTVLAGTTYFYRVTAYNAMGNSTESNVATVTTSGSAPQTQVPMAPNSLVAVAASAAQVNLTWADTSSDETGFRVERASDAAFTIGQATFTIGANTTSFTDTSAAAATTYYYRIVAFNSAGDSPVSNVATATTPASSTPGMPAAPAALAAVAVSATQVNLTWVDSSTVETGFRIERSSDAAFTTIQATFTVVANATTYSDVSVPVAATYYYRVFALSDVGDSPVSNVATVTIQGAASGALVAPGSLVATAVSANQVDLTWADNSNAETGFRVERAADAAFTAGKVTFQVPANSTAYTDGSAAAAATYCYRVFAVGAAGDSVTSNIATVVTPPLSLGSTPGGSGTSAPAPVSLSGLSSQTNPRVDLSGIIESAVQLASQDGKVTIDIAASARLLDAQGKPLTAISYNAVASPPGSGALFTCNLGPDGARFDSPITLTMKYDLQALPAGITENGLQISWWDGTQWQPLESTVNTAAKTVSARVQHFCQFSIMATKALAPATAVAAPAGFSISGLTVTPESCLTAEAVTISVMVSNNSGSAGVYPVSLKVNGVPESNQTISLNASEKRVISFTTKKETPGTYKVDVNGLSTSFLVEAGSATPAPALTEPAPAAGPDFDLGSLDWKIILAIFGGVILVGLVFYSIDKQRRG